MRGCGTQPNAMIDAATGRREQHAAPWRRRAIVLPVLSILLLAASASAQRVHSLLGGGLVPARASHDGAASPVTLAAYPARADLGVPGREGLPAPRTPMSIRLDQDLPDSLLRVLTRRSPHDPAWYPSPFQTGPARVLVSGRVDGASLGAFRAVYLRVVESVPADELPGVSGAGSAVDLRGIGSAAVRRVGAGVYRLTTGPDGRFRAEARFVREDGTQPASGHGFFVEASGDPGFPCGERCARTGVFRLWKRVYVEMDAMYRAGAAIQRETPSGSTRVEVDDVRPFRGARADRPVEVILMRAPRAGITGEDRDSGLRREEPNLVVGVVRPDKSAWRGEVELAYPTLRSFGPEGREPGLGDAIVVPAGGTFPRPSLEATRRIYEKAFVEMVELPNPSPRVPHRAFDASRGGADFSAFTQTWSDYGPAAAAGTVNTVMVVAADHKTDPKPRGKRERSPAIGSCHARPAYVASVFLWLGTVDWQVKAFDRGIGIGGRDASMVADELVMHELAHVFGVDDAEGRGARLNADGTGLSTMTHPVGPEMGDGVFGFHAAEYRAIRRHRDPLAQ